MKVTSIERGDYIPLTKTDVVKNLRIKLESLAKTHNISVQELVDGAQNAGDRALPFQMLALNLFNRLELLSGE